MRSLVPIRQLSVLNIANMLFFVSLESVSVFRNARLFLVWFGITFFIWFGLVLLTFNMCLVPYGAQIKVLIHDLSNSED
jgi:hypothetical protein